MREKFVAISMAFSLVFGAFTPSYGAEVANASSNANVFQGIDASDVPVIQGQADPHDSATRSTQLEAESSASVEDEAVPVQSLEDGSVQASDSDAVNSQAPAAQTKVPDGWVQQDGMTYYYQNGAPLKQNQKIDGKWYWFDPSDGHMLTGSVRIAGKWYRYDPKDGHMLFGVQNIDGKWYYYDPYAGYMHMGSTNIDGKWYWYDLNQGFMLFGVQNIYGKWYYYDPYAGYMHMGFTNIDGKWYWYDLNQGFMLFGKQRIYYKDFYFHPFEGYLTSGNVSLYPYTLDKGAEKELSTYKQTYPKTSYTTKLFKEALDPSGVGPRSTDAVQFMELNRGYRGVSADSLNRYIDSQVGYWEMQYGRRSTLRGMGDAIVQISRETGVNEMYILAHAALESAWGCSNFASGTIKGYEGYYNYFGIGAFDLDPNNAMVAYAKKFNWNSPAAALRGGVEWISRYYLNASYDIGNGYKTQQNTLYKMRFAPGLNNFWHQYATDVQWPKKIAKTIYNEMQYFGIDMMSMSYDWPLYS